MSLDREFSEDGKELTIFLEEKFDFGKVQDFRLAYTEGNDGVSSIVINLQKTEYMDSSALGMLLNMQKSLRDSVQSFKITHCRPQVLKILQIAHFGKKFDIA
ncbi:STAS domain-containing protein [uncultured Paraglaciecola sp.]|jgi:HptB-dependent secretion and biofilm anti anti-sigma factor|uniref:STAS domain-containing protein n=1 Tax=uncultured Paraglaciecola sp. TaxID=1765024 RepID=UPI0025E2DFDA|nr:STAS domain-containing protein [uncultured Paraglaciecola sp.]